MNEEALSLIERAAGVSSPSVIRPMRYANAPAVDARYWTAITLASIFGCNLGDCLSFYVGWNHWIGLAPLAVIFAALLIGERRSTRTTQGWYWSVVIVLRAAATNLADLATYTFQWPFPRVILGLSVIQALVVWPVLPRLIAAGTDRTGRPATNGWYWLSLLTAGTLGTAIGDWTAEELHFWHRVRYARAQRSLCCRPCHRDPVALDNQSRLLARDHAIRAAGTTAGDWLAFRDCPGLKNGLEFGLPLSTALTCALFVATLLLKTSATERLTGTRKT
jgi:Repeat of Unknown Function (DUF347)